MRLLAKLKYWFDLGGSLMPIISFTLLLIAVSDKFGGTIGISSRAFILIAVPCGLIGLVVVGVVLDKAGFARHYQSEQNRRNEMLAAALKK